MLIFNHLRVITSGAKQSLLQTKNNYNKKRSLNCHRLVCHTVVLQYQLGLELLFYQMWSSKDIDCLLLQEVLGNKTCQSLRNLPFKYAS